MNPGIPIVPVNPHILYDQGIHDPNDVRIFRQWGWGFRPWGFGPWGFGYPFGFGWGVGFPFFI